MTNKELILMLMKRLGEQQAKELMAKASEMDGAELIDSEYAIPEWDAQKDYSDAPVGTPVRDEDQVWTLIIPHNAADYPQGRPSSLRSLWDLAHTTNPKAAKAFVQPYGTSGLYKFGECYKNQNGTVFVCAAEQTNYDASDLPSAWTVWTE